MPTVQLHATKYEQLIARRGRDVAWQEAILCSCFNPDSGQPAYSCNACGGRGYIYEAPVTERALVMSITANKEFEEFAGVFNVGDAVMTVPKRVFKPFTHEQNGSGVTTLKYERDNLMFDIGMYDLVTLLDDEVKTSELLQKGTPMYGRPADTLLNEQVTSVLRVLRSNPETGVVTTYTQGTDYTLDGHRINWIGTQPSEGSMYSVVYKHRPVYTVLTTLPKPRHQDGQDLPRYVALRYRAGGYEPK